MSLHSYKNSFYNPKYQDSKPIIQTSACPIGYKRYLIYQRTKDCFDIVKDGVCIGMYAGINGAKKRIDKLCQGLKIKAVATAKVPEGKQTKNSAKKKRNFARFI